MFNVRIKLLSASANDGRHKIRRHDKNVTISEIDLIPFTVKFTFSQYNYAK